MTDGRTHDRKPDRHIHALLEASRLEGNHPLVVVEGDERIVPFLLPFVKHCVRGERAVDEAPLRAERLESGDDRRALLRSEDPAVPGVRVERGDRDSRVLDAEELPESAFGDAHARRDPLRRHRRGHVPEGDVPREDHDAKAARDHHHLAIGSVEETGEKLGMAHPRVAGERERFLRNGTRDDALDEAALREGGGGFDREARSAASLGGGSAEPVRRIRARVDVYRKRIGRLEPRRFRGRNRAGGPARPRREPARQRRARADDEHVRAGEGARREERTRYLGADAPRIPDGEREAHPAFRHPIPRRRPCRSGLPG